MWSRMNSVTAPPAMTSCSRRRARPVTLSSVWEKRWDGLINTKHHKLYTVIRVTFIKTLTGMRTASTSAEMSRSRSRQHTASVVTRSWAMRGNIITCQQVMHHTHHRVGCAERAWHPACLACDRCHAPLVSAPFSLRAGRPWCLGCLHQASSRPCQACPAPISEWRQCQECLG